MMQALQPNSQTPLGDGVYLRLGHAVLCEFRDAQITDLDTTRCRDKDVGCLDVAV